MKPNFALSLSFEGIKLLHRAAGGWREVGEVDVTSEDLGAELAMLRKTAASLEPGGVRTKLLIPESQIKYLTIDTVGLSEAARRKEAEIALHDATPYEISELAYDISLDGAKTHVAAVARETLLEAEAFATEHRFHPVSFVAVPGDAPYLGEPFFGMTNGAADLLEAGEVVEPDGIAVVVVGAVAPSSTTEPASQPEIEDTVEETAPEKDPAPHEPEPETGSVPDTSGESPADPTPTEPDTAENAAPDAPSEAKADYKPVDEPAVQSDAQTPAAEQAGQKVLPLDDAPTPPATPEPTVAEPAPQGADAPAPVTAPEAEASDAAIDTPEAAEKPDTTNIPDAARAAAIAAAAVSAPSRTPTFSTTAKTPPEAPATTGFASRRNGAPTPAKPLGGAQRIAVATPKPDSSSLTQAAPAADTADAAPAPASGRMGFLSRRKPRKGAAAPIPAPRAAVAAAGTEAERMTVFGARNDQVGGKPRFLGLMMTVILLIFLAGVAAWAAVFLDDGIAGLIRNEDTRTTASAPENQIDPEVIRTPEGLEQDSSTQEVGVQVAALDPVLSAEDSAVLDALVAARPEPERPVISEQEAAARYAVTGIWPLAPDTPLAEAPTPEAPVYRSSIDAVSAATDALALPAPQAFDTDVQLASVASPQPFGQRTELDAGGLIVPSATGVVTPDGYTLFAASPPLKPPATLARFATPTTIARSAAIAALAGLRPQNRPQGLAERSERAQLGGVSRIELAAYRPSLRPKSLQERARKADEAAKEAEEARTTAAAAAAATAAAAAALVVPEPTQVVPESTLRDVTRLATAKSVRPDTRPRNFARIVERAERAAPKETRVAAAASVAPRTVTPSLPSKASVARSATVKNAINLRKVNLIGVYGKPSSRRALVRLSNGRYKKVRVGDRIDGGRVSAISNSELRYSKSGRNVVLKMP